MTKKLSLLMICLLASTMYAMEGDVYAMDGDSQDWPSPRSDGSDYSYESENDYYNEEVAKCVDNYQNATMEKDRLPGVEIDLRYTKMQLEKSKETLDRIDTILSPRETCQSVDSEGYRAPMETGYMDTLMADRTHLPWAFKGCTFHRENCDLELDENEVVEWWETFDPIDPQTRKPIGQSRQDKLDQQSLKDACMDRLRQEKKRLTQQVGVLEKEEEMLEDQRQRYQAAVERSNEAKREEREALEAGRQEALELQAKRQAECQAEQREEMERQRREEMTRGRAAWLAKLK